ncbi:hypothetical protein DICVIV_00282 [Dictyocaulus viviparus]|uniref:BTB domain-containing protein n=1 Tax=Dictyocaulus viviparus TaxID=29172 RepID=A0A0D8YBF3_DICVI|nr:hypothetical protein DICVIV_00282 [Dictyocaulus viviparus]
MLMTGRNTSDVVEVLTVLARKRVRDTGRQVAASDCAQRLLDLFFDGKICGAKELVLMLCEGSTDIREKMGEAHAIQKIVESSDNSTLNCRLLAAFAQEAWGRAALRESGMAYLVRNRVFVDTVVKDVTEFVAEAKVVCKPEIISEDDQLRPDSPLLMEIESCLQKKEDNEDSPRLHKDYSSPWFYTTPSPSLSLRSSPLYSFPSSGVGSPASVLTVSPLASPHPSQSSAVDVESTEADESKLEKNCMSVGNERTIIESELWLLTWQAQEDGNLAYLNREDVVNAILSYLALIPSPDYRIGRILRRLAGCRPFIDSLLSMQFHTRVLHSLCIAPCKVVRFARRCARCERAAEFGREILRVFGANVDSDFGNSFLIKRLTSDDFNTRIIAAIAKIALIRDRFGLGRISSNWMPALNLLFDSLHSLLINENFPEICNQTTYEGGPPVCAQIVEAISTLIVPQKLSPKSDREMLVFETDSGEELAQVPMEVICESSRYFQGMFTSDMHEKCSGLRRFVFDPDNEDCTAEDFTRFLHYLSGCRSACSAAQSPQTCIALIKLSDRYLCPMLSEYVCSPYGPVRRLIKGETLSFFLPAVLTTQTHERLVTMCLLILARYCTSSLIVSALCSICHSRLLVDSFIEHLKKLTAF